jgi:hypothetical protein
MTTCCTRIETQSDVFEFDGLAMLIGSDQAGRMLEVGLATAEGIELIVHAMTARAKCLR